MHPPLGHSSDRHHVVALSWRPSGTTEVIHEVHSGDALASPVSIHMIHDSYFVLDASYSWVSGGECCAPTSDVSSDPVRTFLNGLHESLPLLRSVKRVVHMVSAGECMVCFGCEKEVWTFGMNVLGDLPPTSMSVAAASAFGDDVRKEGNSNTVPQLALLTPPVHPTDIAVGLFHLLVVDPEGDVWAAGQGSSGELGGGERVAFQSGLNRVPLPYPEKEEDCEEEGLDDGRRVRGMRVYAGGKTSVVVAQRGRAGVEENDCLECVYTFGSGAYFKLGHGADDDELRPRCVSGLWAGGLRKVREVACGRFHMALLAEETRDVYVWGWAKFGQFGGEQGVEKMFCEPHLLKQLDDMLDERIGENVTRVVCGSRHTALLTNTGRILTMGALDQAAVSPFSFPPDTCTEKDVTSEEVDGDIMDRGVRVCSTSEEKTCDEGRSDKMVAGAAGDQDRQDRKRKWTEMKCSTSSSTGSSDSDRDCSIVGGGRRAATDIASNTWGIAVII